GLLDRPYPEGDQDAGEADDQECELPGIDLAENGHDHVAAIRDEADDGRADDEGEAGADTDTQAIDAEREAQAFRREIVGNHGIGGRREGRFADADAHAVEEELPIGVGGAAERRHDAPYEDADGDDVDAIAAVDQAADGKACDAIKHSKSKALQQAHLCVGDAEIALNGPDEEAQNLPVDEGLGVGEYEDTDDVPGLK